MLPAALAAGIILEVPESVSNAFAEVSTRYTLSASQKNISWTE